MFQHVRTQGSSPGHASPFFDAPTVAVRRFLRRDRIVNAATAGLLTVLLLLSSAWAPAHGAEAPRQLKWEDLVVTLPNAENPFAGLSTEQLDMLTDIGAFRYRKARGEKLLPQEVEIERTSLAKLETMGVPVDALLAKRDEIAKKLKDLESAANKSLDGKLIRMPGFLLPLEYSGKRVSEFLLVPWVGACIHTPPPNPNQIVYVKSDKPYEIKGTYDPVWVTGRMTARANTKSVYITDGSSEVDSSYAVQASRVDPYP
jgi:hypothetical protein